MLLIVHGLIYKAISETSGLIGGSLANAAAAALEIPYQLIILVLFLFLQNTDIWILQWPSSK